MAYDPTNPYVREAIAAGVSDVWIRSFILTNDNDYHRILAAASGDAGAYGGKTPGSGGSSLVLSDLSPSYQLQIRPDSPVSIPGAPLLGALGAGSPLLLLVAVAVGAWYLYKRL